MFGYQFTHSCADIGRESLMYDPFAIGSWMIGIYATLIIHSETRISSVLVPFSTNASM